jgi:hypothetical protein
MDTVLRTLNRMDFDDVVNTVGALNRTVEKLDHGRIRSPVLKAIKKFSTPF